MPAPVIVWFRRDLRLADNPALAAALARGGAVVPAVADAAALALGPAAHAWRAHSLRALDAELRQRGSRLVVRAESAAAAISALALAVGARAVVCARDWTPTSLAEETAVARALADAGVALEVHEGQLLLAPPAIETASGGPYRVFTPYHRAWMRMVDPASLGALGAPEPGSAPGPAPESAPARIAAPERWPDSAPLPEPDPAAPDVAAWWTPGEAGAARRLAAFVREHAATYAEGHDRADLDATSRLSPHLAWGELSPRQVVAAVSAAGGAPALGSPAASGPADAAAPFIRQLAWREFAYHVLHHFPELPEKPFRPAFAQMPWADDPAGLEAWRAGRTGFPLVDAGMRELATTGWMHNRARLVAGSFLAKHLLLPWQLGESWFAERLVDADLALNAFNWQWVAGSGADAAPYFRIFNPMLQGAKVDPDGAYVRRWIPELAEMPALWIHRPHEAPEAVVSAAGVVLGETYPRPIVDHAEARARALAAFAVVRAR